MPRLQYEFVDVEFGNACLNAYSAQIWGEVVGAVKYETNAAVQRIEYALKPICRVSCRRMRSTFFSPVQVEMRSLGTVVTVEVAYARGQEIDSGADKFFDIFRVCQDS